MEALRRLLGEENEADSAFAGLDIRSGRVASAASFLARDPMTQQLVAGTRARASRATALEQAMNRLGR